MTKKFAIPVVLLLLAGALQLIAHHYYGSRYHQAFLTIVSFALVADALWLTGKMIYRGQTPLPSMPAYFWLFRFLAVVAIILGILDAAHLAGLHLPGLF